MKKINQKTKSKTVVKKNIPKTKKVVKSSVVKSKKISVKKIDKKVVKKVVKKIEKKVEVNKPINKDKKASPSKKTEVKDVKSKAPSGASLKKIEDLENKANEIIEKGKKKGFTYDEIIRTFRY